MEMSPSDVRERRSDFKEELAAYLDDRMSADEAREFIAWLEAHPAAWKEAEEARRVWAILAAYRDEPVPEGFAERVLARVTENRAGREPIAAAAPSDDKPVLSLLASRRARIVAIAAGLVAAVGVGVVGGRLTERRTTEGSDDTVAAINAVPAGVLDRLEEKDLVQIASLSDEEFEILLAADPQDFAPADSTKPHGG